MGFSGTPKDMGPPKMVSGTHTIPISLGIRKWEWYGNSMGPAYHKGVPLLGVPGITIDLTFGILEMIIKHQHHILEAPSRTSSK